ncbi:MAG: diguanylate cyclase, partial [Deltaproteobacteria bacterium]|nr:diguanylate cyclase [Deltaproteobacteria bacterium]
MAIRIRTKIAISFASILILLSFLGLIAYYNRNILFYGMFGLEQEIYKLGIFSDIQLAIDKVVMPANDYLITGDLKEREKFQKLAREVEDGFKRLEGLEAHREHAELYTGAMERFAVLKKKAEEIFAIPNPIGDKRGARLMYDMDAIASDIITNYMDRYYTRERDEIKEAAASAGIVRKRVDMLLFTGGIAAVVTIFLLVSYLIRSILRPILEFKEGARIIGTGDLNYRIAIRDGLEINLLVDEFNRMAERLKGSYADLEEKVEERTKELNELNIRLKELSITDGLTGAYNHKHFYEMLTDDIKRAARYNHPLSLIIADIDYFKHYNDSRGHLQGDNVLKGVASCIMRNVRAQDIVARYGGEEFVIIALETGKDGARELAERIRRCVSLQPFPYKDAQPGGNLTISLG